MASHRMICQTHNVYEKEKCYKYSVQLSTSTIYFYIPFLHYTYIPTYFIIGVGVIHNNCNP